MGPTSAIVDVGVAHAAQILTYCVQVEWFSIKPCNNPVRENSL